MSDFSMADISSLYRTGNSSELMTSATSNKGKNELDMDDFLQLMITQLTNQTIDDTMDTSEMMNQMVQMQMVTAITNMTEASVMGYAASLVGQVVTIGILNDDLNLEEREIQVMGTGTMDGQQVIFGSDGNTYKLSQIMAVGRLPDENGKYPGVSGVPGGSEDKPAEGAEESGGAADKPVEAGDAAQAGSGDTEYQGGQGAPAD